ncbi:MAG: glycine cleavage T C-terminal barrel domain-containing protein [Bryobacteraceae bacterium]
MLFKYLHCRTRHRWRTVPSAFSDGNTAPTPGTSLTTRGNATAEITSAAFSPALAKVVALAYVRTA